MEPIAVLGLLVLLLLAVSIGGLLADHAAQDEAWQRIEEERRGQRDQ